MKQTHQDAVTKAIVAQVEGLLKEKWPEIHEDYIAKQEAHDSDRKFKFQINLSAVIEQLGDAIRVHNSISWSVKKHADCDTTISGTPDMFEGQSDPA